MMVTRLDPGTFDRVTIAVGTYCYVETGPPGRSLLKHILPRGGDSQGELSDAEQHFRYRLGAGEGLQKTQFSQ